MGFQPAGGPGGRRRGSNPGKGEAVYVVTVTNEKVIDTKRSGAELAKHLARHGVKVVLDTVDAAGRSIGDVLEVYVVSRNADLLLWERMGTLAFESSSSEGRPRA